MSEIRAMLASLDVVYRRRILVVGLICGLVFSAQGAWSVAAASAGQASGAGELIQLVNQLRSANGLEPYRKNNALMAAAQGHSEYQAAIGNVTHTGQGGSRAKDRAISTGYGGGAAVSVSENIAGGMNLTASTAVQWWQGDSIHLTTMLSPDYQDVGAGVAVAGDQVYYTLVVGYVAGAQAPPPDNVNSETPLGPTSTPFPTAEIVIPIILATPNPDGAIIHVVRQGQALYGIATAYKVNISDLLALNGLTLDSVIFPGNELLIKAADATSTDLSAATPLSTPRKSPSPETAIVTPRPSRTPSNVAISAKVAEATPISLGVTQEFNSLDDGDINLPLQSPDTQVESQPAIDSILVVIALMVVLGTGLVLASTLLSKKPS